ncbi:MAG: beta-N-acetylhexosaminidase [Alphaproteobacteria bacterium]|nr:beta-N-acetylhexosaminidase [Alphaproteobacteria bacterium]
MSGREAVPRAVIFGCAGPRLSPSEASFFRETDPLGFILFARNCIDPDQIRALVDSLRAAGGRADAPVLIDQEGGRVMRLCPPHWPDRPAAARFAALAERDEDAAARAAKLNARLIANDLHALGITVDCAPVLDVRRPETHDVIGDRAYGENPGQVAALGRAVAEGFLEGGVLPVVKHVPGHGRARADSHLELPAVETPRAELEVSDFAPFRELADMPWAMTAHVLYTALDAKHPATTSPSIVAEVIRGWIGFDGVLLSDDLSMKALGGSFAERTRLSLGAGCDVALHCNGNPGEMEQIATACAALTPAARRRIAAGEARRGRPAAFDTREAAAALDALLANA